MGGHKVKRDSDTYASVVRIAKRLSESGFVVASGGGPGAMEACHLGAFCAGAPEERVVEAISKLRDAPELPTNLASIVDNKGSIDYFILEKLHAWQRPAFELAAEHELSAESLAIPTWHYGHEPPTPFASYLAKYFQNSLREDGLLAIAKHGIIFVEGRAGTLQEIFQDAAQNYYESFDWFSPMVFFGEAYWTDELPVVGTLKRLFSPDDFDRYVKVTDSIAETRDFIDCFRPEP
jgi:predicted Rossmann-fold nucleotide-binding protein